VLCDVSVLLLVEDDDASTGIVRDNEAPPTELDGDCVMAVEAVAKMFAAVDVSLTLTCCDSVIDELGVTDVDAICERDCDCDCVGVAVADGTLVK
jgi:hypothetical protein